MVYRAQHLRLGRQAALKLIAPELAEDSGFRQRFERESRIAASLDHPNVIPLYEAGEEDGQLFIAMRFVPGTDLRDVLALEGSLGVDRATRLVSQVASALDEAHSHGLVHRDVKPGNVLIAGLGTEEHAYLTDFGLTKEAGSGESITKTGAWVGTLNYVAPEQIEGKPVNARADIYALGCLLYESLTGEVPYPRDSDVAKMYAHLNEPPPRASALRSEIDPALDRVIERAMAKAPEDRYPSAGDLGRAALAAAHGREVSQPERSVAVGDASLAPTRVRTRPPAQQAETVGAPGAAPVTVVHRESETVRDGPTGHVGAAGPSLWKQPRRWVPVATVVVVLLIAGVVLAAALPGSGGGGSPGDARAVLDKAFKTSIPSADMTLAIGAQVQGVPTLAQPVSLKVAGPYQSNGKGKLPNFNWQISVSGGGQGFAGGLISTGDNVFVNFQGTNYEVGAAKVAQFNQRLASQTGSGKTLKDFGIDPQSWVQNPQDKGSENVNGADTNHVQGTVDVGKMVTDFNKTIASAGGAMGSSTPSQLSPATIAKVQQIVKNPTFDLWVGKSDNRIRRMSVKIDFQIPAAQQAQFQGASGGTLTFQIDFAKVGQPQTVTAPANPRPISELQQQLGGLGGGLGGLGGSGSSGSGSGGSSGSGGTGGSGGGTPTPAQLQKYSKCLQSGTSIQQCSKLIK